MRIGIFLAALLGGASAAAAQPVPPDPATLTLPDMTPTRDPEVIEDGWKHFYFHKAGVSYEKAYADFAECYRFLPVEGASPDLPMFAPWSESPGVETVQPSNNFGLVGVLIADLFAGQFERRHRQGRMRRCMEPRGYVRYPLAEDSWSKLIDHYSLRSIALQALAASGPAPDLPQVTK